jgi:TetR/AcrR family transcriptional repressor of nem operon
MREVKQPRARITREKVIVEAGLLFALKGYHDTTVEDILRAAGVTTGAFFHHFKSKEELAFAVIDRHMVRRREILDQIEQSLPPGDEAEPLTPVYKRLAAIAEMVRRREHARGGCVIGNLSTALADTHDGFRRRLSQCFDEMAEEFVPHLGAAARAHGKTNPKQIQELARYIVSVIEGAIMLARARRDRRLIARQFDVLKLHLKHSVCA